MLATHNQSQAMMKSVMHMLRRHLSPEQVLIFADALPPLPRGIFIEGWRPVEEPRKLVSARAFTADVFADLAPHHVPPDTIVTDVFTIFVRFSSPGQEERMRAVLPEALKPVWPGPI